MYVQLLIIIRCHTSIIRINTNQRPAAYFFFSTMPDSYLGKNEMILDIGPDSISRAAQIIGQAKTVVWNGTLGYAEIPQFAHGSARVALTLATNPGITSVVGGGDTADFVIKWDAAGGGSFSHVSTGGGASLDLMAGASMPGIDSLMDARK